MDTRRDQIVDFIKRDLIGPDPIAPNIQENGEEILKADPPVKRYIAGILFPKMTTEESIEIARGSNGREVFEEEGVDDAPIVEKSDGSDSLDDDVEEALDLSNAYKPSAISITATVRDGDVIRIDVSTAKYETKSDQGKAISYYRKPITWSKTINFPQGIGRFRIQDDDENSLEFLITHRYKMDNSSVYTFSLINTKDCSSISNINSYCYFQAEFSISSKSGFLPLSEPSKLSLDNKDYFSNRMLYRKVKSYAMGHGCAAEWEEKDNIVHLIRTSIFPQYEIKPVIPNTKIEGVTLSMEKLSNSSQKRETIEELQKLCEAYDEWIDGLKLQVTTIDDKDTANRHINDCIECSSRMKDGVELLKTNSVVMTAFQLMNKAMLMQQIHYNLPLQKWDIDENDECVLEKEYDIIPDVNNKETWYGDKERYGKWRPFQLAFVLINLRSMIEKKDDSRRIVDLIWFPTGGGKTEAYLGLSAYTIFVRRLINKNDNGTAIIMRYTLRLLTSQQYERASALICSCEIIRRENEALLGSNQISIGLWVGDATSPNKMDEAVERFDALYDDPKSDNPFVILKCPWCGAQMGPVIPEARRTSKLVGYIKDREGAKSVVRFQCRNIEQRCSFSEDDSYLPLYVIDDDIYKKKPTLIIGTVDKFAMIPFRPEAQVVFGLKNGQRENAPDLIIQDELHLISGPLGSMVGHYETMIDELCSYEDDGHVIKPKIIASTATISRAAEQCNALYASGKVNVKQFPPPGLDAGDSFFAIESKNGEPGRRYVGILASGASSTTTLIRLYANLLYAAKEMNVQNESERDAYWTNMGYFNSIRELGQAETWIRADIEEYLQVKYRRLPENRTGEKLRRYIYREEELTSRIRGDKIPATLQALKIEYPSLEKKPRPIDICLATNMISVGVDVSRLGLMTVTGQPKTTSEYIQATSRVGRDKKSPGLVFVVYNPSRSRDKSHYENFVSYHSKIYSNVEPTSVTPFSAPLRARALYALIIGILRLESDEKGYKDPPKYPKQDTIDRITKIILSRVAAVEADELEETENQIKEFFDEWHSTKDYQRYSAFNSADDKTPLMIPADMKRNEKWYDRGYYVPTSMRSVDTTCDVELLKTKRGEK